MPKAGCHRRSAPGSPESQRAGLAIGVPEPTCARARRAPDAPIIHLPGLPSARRASRRSSPGARTAARHSIAGEMLPTIDWTSRFTRRPGLLARRPGETPRRRRCGSGSWRARQRNSRIEPGREAGEAGRAGLGLLGQDFRIEKQQGVVLDRGRLGKGRAERSQPTRAAKASDLKCMGRLESVNGVRVFRVAESPPASAASRRNTIDGQKRDRPGLFSAAHSTQSVVLDQGAQGGKSVQPGRRASDRSWRGATRSHSCRHGEALDGFLVTDRNRAVASSCPGDVSAASEHRQRSQWRSSASIRNAEE